MRGNQAFPSKRRAALALLTGAATGGGLSTLSYALVGGDKPNLLLVAIQGSVFWGVALLAIGAPAWLLLHNIGFKSRLAAGLAGFILPLLFAIATHFGRILAGGDYYHWMTPYTQHLYFLLSNAVSGAFAGLAGWQALYGRARP